MIDYIQCTHCGKRYAASDEIREAEGQFTECQACKEKFLIVVHAEVPEELKVVPDDDVVSTGGWDPSLTMPGSASDTDTEESDSEQFLDEDDDGGAQVLQKLQAERKKKQHLYILVGVVLALVIVALWFVFMNDEVIAPTQNKIPDHARTAAQITQGEKVQDANSIECRQAAAQQWIIDYRAMHSKYSGDEFVRILKMSEQQTQKVREFCQSGTIIQEIIASATVQEKPAWLRAEIKTLQDSHQH